MILWYNVRSLTKNNSHKNASNILVASSSQRMEVRRMDTPILPKQISEIKSHTCGIYLITCLPTSERYIGSSVDVRKRLREHRGHLLRNDHGNHHLQSAWNKYGCESFDFKLLEVCDFCVRNKRERELIIELCPEWNLKLPNLERDTWTASEETRARISAAGKGRKFSDEHKAKMGAWQIGKKLSQETKDKIAAAHKGRKLSQETKQKLSEKFKGRHVSPETIAKRKEALIRKKQLRFEELQGDLF